MLFNSQSNDNFDSNRMLFNSQSTDNFEPNMTLFDSQSNDNLQIWNDEMSDEIISIGHKPLTIEVCETNKFVVPSTLKKTRNELESSSNCKKSLFSIVENVRILCSYIFAK